MCACVCVCVCDCVVLTLSPGLFLLEFRGRGVKRESLVHIVCACTNYCDYRTRMHYPRKDMEVSVMGVYKNTEIPKNVLDILK